MLCRSLEQLDLTLACGLRSVLVDFQDIRQYADAVASAHLHHAPDSAGHAPDSKAGRGRNLSRLARHGADGILVRNLAGLDFFASRACRPWPTFR